MLKKWLLALGIILALSASAAAQTTGADGDDDDDVINTDSPSLTNSAHCVGTGTVQVESGMYYLSSLANPPTRGPRGRDEGGGSVADQYAVPYLFRIGTSDDFELRFSGDLVQVQGPELGISDLTVGFKWRLLDDPEGWSFAIMGNVEAPTGSGSFRGVAFAPGLTLITDRPLGEDTSLVLNASATLDREDVNGPSYIDWFAGACVTQQLTDEWSGYLELSTLGPDQATNGVFQTIADAGLSWTINKDFVFNMAVFRGLSNTGANWGGYVGYGAKF